MNEQANPRNKYKWDYRQKLMVKVHLWGFYKMLHNSELRVKQQKMTRSPRQFDGKKAGNFSAFKIDKSPPAVRAFINRLGTRTRAPLRGSPPAFPSFFCALFR